jgi:hypothetical protein
MVFSLWRGEGESFRRRLVDGTERMIEIIDEDWKLIVFIQSIGIIKRLADFHTNSLACHAAIAVGRRRTNW